MKVGTICYATNRGLGHLAYDFYRKGLITDALVVRHPSIPTNEHWYPGAVKVSPAGVAAAGAEFVKGLDVLLVFETPFHWPLFDLCRGFGVRSYLVTMYECTPERHVAPDVYLCPSALDMDYFRKRGDARPVRLPVEYPWKLRERARHFVHNGGYLGVRARGGVQREGTTTLIEAMRYVQSPIKLTIRVQENVEQKYLSMAAADFRIQYHAGTVPYSDLYREGDVAVGAQRWNGCSLPLQEAFASGMLVMNTDRYPTNGWLPRPPLFRSPQAILHSSIGGPYMKFTEYCPDPRDVASKIDEWYDKDITEYSLAGKRWAEENSWQALLPEWKKTLEA